MRYKGFKMKLRTLLLTKPRPYNEQLSRIASEGSVTNFAWEAGFVHDPEVNRLHLFPSTTKVQKDPTVSA